MIRVRTLGESEIRIGRRRITPATEMVFALALYLCVRAGERVTREEVLETFWASADPEKGRHSLRQMLYRLRQRGFELDGEGAELYLDPVRVDCDLRSVLREEWVENADPATVEAAGQPTPEFTRHVSDQFREWYDGVRDRVGRQHRLAALRQILRARREGRWADLEVWAQHVLRSDPLNEEATFARAESAAMAGSKSMALEILDQYMEELGDRASVIGLPATVLRRRIAERRPEWVSRGPREVPLVGREALMERLTGYVDAAGRGEGRAVVLWGAPGVGKTRLASELIQYAEIIGFRSVRFRALPELAAQPMSAVLGLVTSLTDLPGAAGCDPTSLALLTRATRKQPQSFPHEPLLLAPGVGDDFVNALRELVEAICHECRIAILVEDLHNADVTSVSTLNELMAVTRLSRLLWISTSRDRGVYSRVAPRSLKSQVEELPVTPLVDDCSARLVDSICDLDGVYLASEERARIARASGGNPLFVRELVLHSARSAASGSLPSSLREVMRQRLAQADLDQIRLLRVIALLGSQSTLTHLRALVTLNSPTLSSHLEQLELEGVLRLSSDRALELHECWSSAVLEQLGPVLRATLSHDCALVLSSEESSFDSTSREWRAAELFADAGAFDTAIALLTKVGDQMQARGLLGEAASIYERALGIGDVDRSSLALRARYARALHASGCIAESLSACAGAQLAAQRCAVDHDASTHISCVILECAQKLSLDHRVALDQVAKAAADPRVSSDARLWACLTGIVAAFNDESSLRQEEFHRQAAAISANEGPSVIAALVSLIHHAQRGDAEGVSRADGVLASLDSSLQSDQLRCRSLRVRANAHRWAGNLSLRDTFGTQAFELALNAGFPGEALCAAEQMTFAALDDQDSLSLAVWLSRWEQLVPRNAYFARRHALIHAKARIAIDEGHYAAALALLQSVPTSTGRDSLGQRRATDAATTAVCLAALGEKDASIEVIQNCLDFAMRDRPSNQVDYIVEYALRALDVMGRSDLLAASATAYLHRRRDYAFPIARAFGLLSRGLTRSTRTLGDSSPAVQ